MRLRIFLLLCFLPMSIQLALAYENPVLKVLLFKTSSHIDISSSWGIDINDRTFNNYSSKVRIKYSGNGTIKIAGKHRTTNSVFVSAEDRMKIIRKGAKNGRRYFGKIEIKPYHGGFYVINHISVETYLEGVLNAEISTKWDLDVVQAQAIISRTFALYKREKRLKKPWHLTAGQYDQVYLGDNIADHRSRVAIHNTRGIVVNYRGKLAQTYYHSNCGGITEDPSNVWQFSLPYLKIKSVPYGQGDPRYFWRYTLSRQKLNKIAKKLGIKASNFNNIYIANRTESHRVSSLIISNNTHSYQIAADTFRTAAGYSNVQSLLFDIRPISSGFELTGTGNGHGVGLCQWAAKEMADKGYRFDDILRFFYTDTNIQIYRRL